VSGAVLRARTNRVIRLALKAAIVAPPFTRSAEPLLPGARWACLNFGCFADERRRPFFAFECLAKTVG
jgi:hypothetical protein